MKKTYLFLLCFFVLSGFLYAQYRDDVSWAGPEIKATAETDVVWRERGATAEGDIVWAEEVSQVEEIEAEEEPSPKEPRGPFYVKNRTFEIGLMNTTFGFANDFISATDIFRKEMVIDIDELNKGMRINTGISVSPVYFNFNYKDKWGFGISTKLDATGIIGISGSLLTISEAVNDKSDVSGAVFVEAAPSAFFHVKKLKVKVKPAMYYPLVYIKPDISYTNKTTETNDKGETVLKFVYDLQIYTAFSLEDDFSFDSLLDLTASPGFDVSVGVEYPLSEALGLADKFKFLSFDVGLDLINIPAVPASMVNYMKISGQVGKDDPIDFFDDDAFDSFVTIDDTVYGGSKISVLRPFKMLAWAAWRPFAGKQFLSFIPSAGFAINPLYVHPFSFEGGMKARMDIRNFFIVTIGTNYNDRLWKNSFDMALNFRIFEIDLGVDVRSQTLLKSFTGAGVGASFGLKFGF